MSCPQVGVRSFAGISCVTLENVGHLDQYRAYVFPGVAGQCLFKGALWSLLARTWNQVPGLLSIIFPEAL